MILGVVGNKKLVELGTEGKNQKVTEGKDWGRKTRKDRCRKRR